MKSFLIVVLLVSGCLSAFGNPVWTLNDDNARAQAYLDAMQRSRAINDQRAMGANAPVPVSSQIGIPSPAVQYVANVPGIGLATIPFSPLQNQGNTMIVVRQTTELSKYSSWNHSPNYIQIRDSYGGTMPYTIVRADSPFVIVSQTNDVLVIGELVPQVTVVGQNLVYQTTNAYGVPVATPAPTTPPTSVVYVEDRLDLAVVLPPGVPSNIIQKMDLYYFQGSTREPLWKPSGIVARRNPMLHASNGNISYDVYQVSLP